MDCPAIAQAVGGLDIGHDPVVCGVHKAQTEDHPMIHQPLPRRLGGKNLRMVSVHGGSGPSGLDRCIEYKKGIRWMPWHQEAMKDVARCEKPWGAASRL